MRGGKHADTCANEDSCRRRKIHLFIHANESHCALTKVDLGVVIPALGWVLHDDLIDCVELLKVVLKRIRDSNEEAIL